MDEKKKTGPAIGGILFTGCMFIGGGIGMAMDNVPVGGAIGMGVGFLAMAAVWAFYDKKSN
jgi:hypothetical protein